SARALSFPSSPLSPLGRRRGRSASPNEHRLHRYSMFLAARSRRRPLSSKLQPTGDRSFWYRHATASPTPPPFWRERRLELVQLPSGTLLLSHRFALPTHEGLAPCSLAVGSRC